MIVLVMSLEILSPPGRSGNTAMWLALKMMSFLLLCAAVSLTPTTHGPLYLLAMVPILILTGYVLPHLSFLYYFKGGTEVEDADFYSTLYGLLFPLLLLSLTLCYRLGGGTAERAFKIGASGAVVLFSGFLDIMWYVVNPLPRPSVIDAPHIVAITGHPVSYNAAVVFTLAHLPLIVLINLLPIRNWIDQVTQWIDRIATQRGSGE
jgi:hypothetical protein